MKITIKQKIEVNFPVYFKNENEVYCKFTENGLFTLLSFSIQFHKLSNKDLNNELKNCYQYNTLITEQEFLIQLKDRLTKLNSFL